MSRAPDQDQRDRAIVATDQTILIDAGAGTGKTTLLVERLLEMVAPSKDGPALALPRIAAVTFTRRAAGELRLRVRAAILRALARGELSALRRGRLLDALGAVDTACIGTIHGFCDRLLCLQPMKAKLSPAYTIAEDIELYVDETFELLLHAVQSGTLSAELDGIDSGYASEVERTFQEAFRAGLLVRTIERDPLPPKVGLDGLMSGFIEHRDREIAQPPEARFDRNGFDAALREAALALANVAGDLPGTRWLVRLRKKLEALRDEQDPIALYELTRFIEAKRKVWRKTKDFEKGIPRDAWEYLADHVFERLLAPLRHFMAVRLVRTRHAIVHLYEKTKAAHQVLDPIDLLLTLRNLLRDDLEARAFYQGLFDHILVDEFQDTDPLQAEIILYLSEHGPAAATWQDVVVGKGRLTVVGDPKQSIYRFRRADIGMYELIRNQIAKGEHVSITLFANFRSSPALLEFVNDRSRVVLGASPKSGKIFDATTGGVYHQDLVPGIDDAAERKPGVHRLPYQWANGEARNAPEARMLEGKSIASYIGWLVEKSGAQVRDLDSEELRPVRYSDITILGLVTTKLPVLFEALDAVGIPYAISGGSLFATDPLHRRFILGLRALADRSDGVAEAALLRPPFFAIDLLDLVSEKAGAGADNEHATRAREARAWIRETRKNRFARPAGATARALLEETGIGRCVALGPNGEQRLALLRELCLRLELRASNDGLDYDGVTSQLRNWIDRPPQLDAPRPIGREAIQIMSVHQAKGLEFPVVILWDGMGLWRAIERESPWRVERNGNGWAVKMDGLAWEEPQGVRMLEREATFADNEKRRLVYVATTRARDLLVIPRPRWEMNASRHVHAQLLDYVPKGSVIAMEPFIAESGAAWVAQPALGSSVLQEDTGAPDRSARWSTLLAESATARHRPLAVTAVAKSGAVKRVAGEEIEEIPRPRRKGRYGPIFGETVHRAIGLVIKHGLEPSVAVERAAASTSLEDPQHRTEAAADVERAIQALKDAGLLERGRVIRLEHPVAAIVEQQGIMNGYIDFVSAALDKDIAVIDFKTDQFPDDGASVHEVFPEYVAQVSSYSKMLGARRAGLLFTSHRLLWI